MARINCYIPDHVKAAWLELDPPVSAAEILRRGIVAIVAERQAEAPVPVPEPVS